MGENRRQALRVLSVLYRPSRYWVIFFAKRQAARMPFQAALSVLGGIFCAALITPCRAWC